MTGPEWLNLLRLRNAKNKSAGGAAIQALTAAQINQTSQFLTMAGGNPALVNDYAAGSSMGSSLTGNTPSTVITLAKEVVNNPILIRITTTVGATPTATFAIQGSLDNSTWFSIDYADIATPDTWGQSTFVITTATTVQKVVRPHQKVKFLRFNMTVNTNVTVTTADAVIL